MDTIKTGALVIGLLAIAAVGYFIFMQPVTMPEPIESPTNTGSSAKIDINAVCDGALAYMTFTSGVEADMFVRECKEGKHPEVIEQWKVQMGITDDRAI